MCSAGATAKLLLSAFAAASAQSCKYGTYSCQNENIAQCVYTSGVETTDEYPTGWVVLETCASGCEVVGGIAQCQATAKTLVKISISTSSLGAVFTEISASTALASLTSASNVVSSSSSSNVLLISVADLPVDATFYYDMNGGGSCGLVNGITDFGQNDGYTFCEPRNTAVAQTLGQRGTNNIVAMPRSLITGKAAEYCGKKVVVTWNGVRRTDLDLFIWDSCAACDANGGLDFSSTIFAELAGTAGCVKGRIKNEMSWEIVDETVLAYNA